MFCFRRVVTRFVKNNGFTNSHFIYKNKNNSYVKSVLHLRMCGVGLHNLAPSSSSLVINVPKLQSEINFKFSSSNNTSDKGIKYEEFVNLVKSEKPVVIDVREKDELRRMGSIPNSINIPLKHVKEALSKPNEEFEKEYGKPKPNKNDKIVMYCQRGPRSVKALREALRQGYNNTKYLEGGWLQWNDNRRQKKE